ncbi:hypothetical protein C8F04DRAFT_1300593 [Mycena alexandri]|uniref:Uncharacterized protein n=1 Tax=Mycena alexandri TaxID=1745969 RepID=A0AAD6WTZ0_9AGAR|nr:hypothetical protein C8F04DRAFT_1300593 [Mycena alexandri]
MRPLSLHSSALNDAEYTLFTENLASLLDSDSDDPEAQTLTIRETRAWMRGRYPGIPATTIDQILALFPSKDTIHGGEFFAALRLVLHVESGKDVDRALAFVQVHPNSAAVADPLVSAPAASQGIAPAPADPADAISPRTPQRYNPFLPGTTPSLTRSKTAPTSSPAPVLPPRRTAAPPSAPVPPPRHPPLPPRAASPPKPPTPAHITSTLMKQSLQASKTGQWLKQGQARLEQERVLRVLRTTSSTPRPATGPETDYMSASASSDGSRSRPLSSIPPSVSSLEQVALASPSAALQRAFDDAYREHDTALPPPMHPDRKSAPPSASSRASASSGSSSRLRASPERDREREKPRPPPKPRSLNSASISLSQSPFASPASHRLTRSNSLRPSPPPPSARAGRVRPESVHALLGGLGARLAESPFGDPVRPHRARPEEREGLVSRHPEPAGPESSSSEDSDTDADGEGGWVGVSRFEDSDADAESPELSARRGQEQRRGRGGAPHARDSLKWPVDVEGEGWRPL